MKKLLFSLLLSISLISFSQAPKEISYQGVARNAAGSVLSNQNIGIKLDLHQGSASGTVVFSETHSKITNSLGLFTLGIGSVNTASFISINWANGPYFMEVSLDPAGGTAYVSVGTQQFMSVPYALYAETSGNASPTPTITINAPNTVTSIGGSYTINVPSSTSYTAGNGIGISGNIISNTSPDQTVTITSSGSASVTGTYPNFTISTPTTQIYTGGNGINISGGVISNTAAIITPSISGNGVASVTNPTSNVYIVDVPSPILSYSPATSVLSLTQGTAVSSTTLNITSPSSVNIVGSGLATVTPTSGNTFTVSVPSPTLSISSGSLTITNGNSVAIPSPSLTVNSNSLTINGPGGNTVLLPSSPSTTLTSGANVIVLGSSPSYTVGSVTPTLTVTGGTLSGLYPNQTLTIPTSSTTVLTQSTGITISGTAPNYTLSSPNQSLTINSNSLSITGGNTITLPSNPTTTLTQGANVTITGSSPSYTVASVTPSLAVTGGTLSGAYPTQTLTIPSSSTTVLTPSTGISISGTAPNYTLSSPNQSLTISSNSISISGGNTITLPASNDWSLIGNSGTVDGTNFIGTTDNLPFSIKVNNQKAGRIDNVNGNTFFGLLSGNANTGINNTAYGLNSLRDNIVGSSNSAFGVGALRVNNAYDNTAVGTSALTNNTYASQNIAIGREALFTQSYSNGNTSWSTDNVAVGYRTLYLNQPTSVSNGWRNTAIGNTSLYSNTIGSSNSAIGFNSLYSNSTGNSNTANGAFSLFSNVAGNNGVALGYYSQYNANSTATSWDNTNTSVGYNSLLGSTTPASNTGLGNTAIGRDAMFSSSSGAFNTAVGINALYFNTTGVNNTAIGREALYNTTTGSDNFSGGRFSLRNNTIGQYNVGIGTQALFSNTSGNYNIAIGGSAMNTNSTGVQNVALGSSALVSNTTGNFNTALGTNADVLSNNLTNATAIGYNAKVGTSNSMVLGGTGVDAVNVGIGTTSPGAVLDVVNVNNTNAVRVSASGTFEALAVKNTNASVTSYAGAFDGGIFIKGKTSTNSSYALKAANSGSVDLFVVRNDGNVGIGIISPSSPLHVVNSAGSQIKFGNSNQPNYNWYFDVDGSANMFLKNEGNGTPFSAMSFNPSNGFVGVGTTSPINKFHVNGSMAITDGSQGVGKVLVSDASGNASWMPIMKITYGSTSCQSIASVSTTPVKFNNNLGTLTKTYSDTHVEVILQTDLNVFDLVGSNNVTYEVKINGISANGNSGKAIYFLDNATVFNVTNNKGVTIVAEFDGLVAGTYNVELWAYCMGGGSASTVYIDPGCFSGSSVIIKEFK